MTKNIANETIVYKQKKWLNLKCHGI